MVDWGVLASAIPPSLPPSFLYFLVCLSISDLLPLVDCWPCPWPLPVVFFFPAPVGRLDVLLVQPLVHVIFCQCPILVTVNDGHLRVNRTRTRLCLCHFVLLVFWACLPQENVCTPAVGCHLSQIRHFYPRNVVDQFCFLLCVLAVLHFLAVALAS